MGRVREQEIINYYCNNSHNNVTIMDAHVNMVMLMDMAMDMDMDSVPPHALCFTP